MPITRHFLEVDRPALPAAADYLIDRYRKSDTVDLGNVVVVVPGRRAGRRLLEILVERAPDSFTPPHIVTEGKLPERLYRLKQPLADQLVQQLAWAKALRELPGEQLQHITAAPPADDDTARWMELGETLRRQHVELAADGLDFADVLRLGGELPDFQETNRWQSLRKVQDNYLHILDGQSLWDVQTARLFAIEHKEIQTDSDIVLLGTVDLNGAMRQMLDQIADRVTALVHAPAAWADRFDEHGCAIPQAWSETAITLSDQQIVRVDGPNDQADAVTRWLASLGGQYRADQITIGLADERIAPQVQRQLDQCQAPSRWAFGKTLVETGPYRLLAAAADYLQRGRFHDFAALVRHVDVYDLLCEKIKSTDFLTSLDNFYNRHLTARLDRDWTGGKQSDPVVIALHHEVKELIDCFPKGKQSPADWSEPIAALLTAVYGRRELDRDDPADRETLAVCQKVRDALVRLQAIPAALAPAVPADEAIRLVLEQLHGEFIPAPEDAEAIELLGWLELALDDAPALAVTSFNDGLVPESVNADAFLPNGLRRHLGLLDNDRRYARDAYTLSVLSATRDDLLLVVGRRDGEGNPLAPSRLLFAADEETVAVRSRSFFAAPSQVVAPRGLLSPGADTTSPAIIEPPQPAALAASIDEKGMRVTSFKSYLACPYRFYLGQVLNLHELIDSAAELDPAAFGSLLHDVLDRFGSNEAARDLTDEKEIYGLLSTDLDRLVEQTYGERLRAAVGVQIEQLRIRLRAFAAWQARWTSDGWRIEWTETSKYDTPPQLDVDGQPMRLRGRIDRIDRNLNNDKRVIFDYKSGDSARSPKQTHQKKGEWIDLQLPLYRRLAESLGIEGPVALGYIVLPKDVSKVGPLLAEWSDEELAEAEETARQVVRDIRESRFWPPTSPPPAFSEEFAAICRDRMYGSALAIDDEEDAA